MWHPYWQFTNGNTPPPITPATFVRGIGDDAFHPGWDRKAWKKRQNREDALEATIRATLKAMDGEEPAAEVVQAIAVQAEAAPTFSPDYSGLEEWIAAQRVVIAQIIARQDDEDDTEFLLLQ